MHYTLPLCLAVLVALAIGFSLQAVNPRRNRDGIGPAMFAAGLWLLAFVFAIFLFGLQVKVRVLG